MREGFPGILQASHTILVVIFLHSASFLFSIVDAFKLNLKEDTLESFGSDSVKLVHIHTQFCLACMHVARKSRPWTNLAILEMSPLIS